VIHELRPSEYEREAGDQDFETSRIFPDLAKGWIYFRTAGMWASAGDNNRAVRNLDRAIDDGWTDLKLINRADALEGLRSAGGWEEVIDQLEQRLPESAHD
jgi:hypothetical protein